MHRTIRSLQVLAVIFASLLFAGRTAAQESVIILDTFYVGSYHWPSFTMTLWSDGLTTYIPSGGGGVGNYFYGTAQGGVQSTSAGRVGGSSGHKVEKWSPPTFPEKGLVYKITVPPNATGVYVQGIKVSITFQDGSSLEITTTEAAPFLNGVRTNRDGTTTSGNTMTDVNSIVFANQTNAYGSPSTSMTATVQSTFIPNGTVPPTYSNTSTNNANVYFDNNNPNERVTASGVGSTSAGAFFSTPGFDSNLLTSGPDTVIRGFSITPGASTQPYNEYLACPSCTP